MEICTCMRLFAKMLSRAVPVAGAAVLGLSAPAYAQLAVTDLTGGITADDLAQSLAGAGVTISNVTFTGAQVAAGSFSGGAGIIGFPDGIILSSGAASGVIGPNSQDGITTDHGAAGDTDLDPLTGGFATQDAAVLEFDFVPQGSSVSFLYVFSSDEYNEFVDSEFNDVFAFFVNGTNCALVGSDPVSINTINNGNPFGVGASSNPTLFLNNDLDDGGGSINTEMDGLTKVLTCVATVNSGATNHMKLAIADVSDGILDANVFIQAGSLSACEPTTEICNGVDDDCDGEIDDGCTTTDGGALIEGAGCALRRDAGASPGLTLGAMAMALAWVVFRALKTRSARH